MRSVMVVGATAVIQHVRRSGRAPHRLAELLKRKSPKLAAVALANKTARIAWKMMVTGETYTAKLDGSDAPVKGAYGYDTVSLKKINARSIEETDKRGGDVIDVSTMTVSPDGKKMTIVDTNKKTDRTSTYVATKQ